MMVEKQTIPHLNALIRDSNVLGEQSCCSTRGCHATSPLKSVLFRRKVLWQLLIELHSCTWHILEPTSRATKWDIICLRSLSGSLSNPLRLKLGKVGVEQIRNRVYVLILRKRNLWQLAQIQNCSFLKIRKLFIDKTKGELFTDKIKGEFFFTSCYMRTNYN